MPPDTRLAAHRDIADALAPTGDRELAVLVESGTPLGTGIGGRSLLIEVAGRRVFVKRVPLTDAEQRPGNVRSTANLFRVPLVCHYGLGSPGFGAWRELAAHTMTTGWVRSGQFSGFPLLHHWRVLPDPPQPLHEELAHVERVVTYWGGAPQVRERIEALRTASASVTLFLEYVPHHLHDWLGARHASGDLDGALALVDFGLALSPRFLLTPEERAFYDRHHGYDHAYMAAQLVNWLVTALYGYRGEERDAFVRACAEGRRPEGAPPAAAGIIMRHAPLTAVRAGFSYRLRFESRNASYPYEALRDAYRRPTDSA
ncbi:protein kinase family protein [Streptomyces nodosus]|uniref:protein kinase family protein n=1 Tax=Streptomyces nodosus TaxID=40318 RepID=UPI00381B1081